MLTINRRTFLRHSASAAASIYALSLLPSEVAAALREKIALGFQSWSVKEKLAEDFAGTLKMMAGQGYKLIEMCSPKGYINSGFAAIAAMKTGDIKKVITDNGLGCPSCHFGLSELHEHLDDRLDFAQQMGLSHMVCSSLGLPKDASLDDFLKAADKLNIAAEKINAAGMQAGFHNHSTEFAELEGRLIYDALLERFDPKLVKMQFQTEVINSGYKAADYFKKYPGRFISAHLSDWTANKKEVPIGQGIIDWKTFFESAATAGVKYHFVEMQPVNLPASATYISRFGNS